jgi:Protein of unknown function, DUF481
MIILTAKLLIFNGLAVFFYKLFPMKYHYVLLFSVGIFVNMVHLNGQIVNIEDKRVRLGDSITFKGYVDLGLNFYKNDKHLTTARASFQVEKALNKHFMMLIGGYNLVKGEGQNFLNDGFLHFRHNIDINRHLVWETFTQIQYNERTRMLFRGLLGGGMRIKLRLAQKQRFYIGTAYILEQNQFRDETPRQLNHRLSTYLSYNVQLPNKSRLVHTTYFQPLLTDFKNFRMASEVSWLMNITNRLIFKATANLSNDNDPRIPGEIPDLTYSWTNGLRWDF